MLQLLLKLLPAQQHYLVMCPSGKLSLLPRRWAADGKADHSMCTDEAAVTMQIELVTNRLVRHCHFDMKAAKFAC